MTVTVRFAPSPTGRLHVGNIRTALFNWLFAKGQGGQFVLRLDDTDLERSTAEFAQGIIDDMEWLGLKFDRIEHQSARFAQYDAAADKLKAAGLLYPCYETADELDRKRKLQRTRGLPPVYDRAALALSEEEKKKLMAEGRAAHWRFKLSGGVVKWTDEVRGEQVIDTASISDPVLIREDGSYLYTLPSIVDDIDFEISHILRGEDHVTNSGAQIEIFEALGAKAPAFAHFPLLVGVDGDKLSKRFGSLSIESIRQDNIEPLALLSQLAKIGTSDPVEVRHFIAELAAEFSFDKIGRAPARFDPRELEALNAKLLHEMPYKAVEDRLAKLGVTGGEEFWTTVRGNLKHVAEAADWWKIVEGPVTPKIEEEDYIAAAEAALPAGEPTAETWGAWTKALKETTGRKGKGLFMPLRQALTGLDHGPEMGTLLPLIGEARIRARLKGEVA